MVEKLNKMKMIIIIYVLLIMNIFLLYSDYSINSNRSHIVSIIIIISTIVTLKISNEYGDNKLKLVKDSFHTIFKTSSAVFIFSNNKILLTNSKANELFQTKIDKENFIDDNPYFKQLMNIILKSQSSLNLLNYKIINHNNIERYYDIKTTKFGIGTKKISIIILKESIKQNPALEEVLPFSQEILAKMSHELRTPINILQGALTNSFFTVQEIQDKEIREKMLRSLATFDRNLLRILKLSDNVIHLMEIDSYHKDLKLTNCNVPNLIKNITDAALDYINEKKLKIELLNNMKTKYCAIDIEKFEKMILNLLSNAIKFGQHNSKIIINIYEKSRELYIEICNKGEKIQPEEQEKIFGLLKQGDNNLLTRTHEGLGVGLHLVNEYAKLHGGKVAVSSDCNGNNVFIIKLPMHINDRYQYVDVVTEVDLCKHKVKVEFSDLNLKY